MVVLDFADEQSVVQTRFATTALALLRAHLGEDLAPRAVADAEAALDRAAAAALAAAEQFTFLGRGWTVGLAQRGRAEDARGGAGLDRGLPGDGVPPRPDQHRRPGPAGLVFGAPPDGLADEVARHRRDRRRDRDLDPLAELVRVQRSAVALAARRGLDPDRAAPPDPLRGAAKR